MVSNRILAAARSTTTHEVVPGRILGLQLRMRDDTRLSFFVVHNERLRAADRAALTAALAEIQSDPMSFKPASLTTLGGDFNFPFQDDATLYVTSEGRLNMHQHEGERRRWTQVLRSFTPVAAPTTTRQEARTTAAGRVEASASAIDHVYISTPPLLQTQYSYRSMVMKVTAARAALSDHAAPHAYD